MIALLGYGKTTKAVAKRVKDVEFFADKGGEFDGFMVKEASQFNPDRYDLCIPSPGLPPNHILVKRSKKILSDYDYFFNEFPFSIWISGTNGKTTTTQMITHLLKDKGAVSGGNIGTPVAELKKSKIWVLETSSYTLHYTNIAKPNIYILLPITPDHLSWHQGFKEYEKAKLKPLQKLKEGEIAIVPKKYENIESKGFIIGYESAKDLANFFDLDTNKIKFKGAFLIDALLALAVTKVLFNESDYEKLNSFKIDSHKQEEFYDDLNRLWVDDSKATNIDATIEAIKRYGNKKIFLILGGDNKGVSLSSLIDFISNFDIDVFAIGKSAKEIENLCKERNINVKNVTYLQDAIKEIKKLHSTKSVALLSPACASLDQFKNYKERGEIFKKEVLRKN